MPHIDHMSKVFRISLFVKKFLRFLLLSASQILREANTIPDEAHPLR